MRRSFCWPAVALVGLIACSCGKDPVLGQWVDSGTGNLSMEFKPDGTMVGDANFDAAAAKLAAQNPLIAAQAQAMMAKARESLKNQKATWVRQGGVYKVTMTNPFTGQPADVYWKIDGKNLVSCKEDGTALQMVFVRKPQ